MSILYNCKMKAVLWIMFACAAVPLCGAEEVFVKYGYPRGATPLRSSRGLKDTSICNRLLLTAAENANIAKAHAAYFRPEGPPVGWMSEEGLRQIHQAMFGDVWEWAGCYHSGAQRNMGIPNAEIPAAMAAFSREMRRRFNHPDKLSPIEESARIIQILTLIHPFSNGNGRFARFVANLYLFDRGGVPVAWPEERLAEEGIERRTLISALEAADRGDFRSLERLMYANGISR